MHMKIRCGKKISQEIHKKNILRESFHNACAPNSWKTLAGFCAAVPALMLCPKTGVPQSIQQEDIRKENQQIRWEQDLYYGELPVAIMPPRLFPWLNDPSIQPLIARGESTWYLDYTPFNHTKDPIRLATTRLLNPTVPSSEDTDVFIPSTVNNLSKKQLQKLEIIPPDDSIGQPAIAEIRFHSADANFIEEITSHDPHETIQNPVLGTRSLTQITVSYKDNTTLSFTPASIEALYIEGKSVYRYNPESIEFAPPRRETLTIVPSDHSITPRRIQVLLPRNYPRPEYKYPVLYTTDGQNVFTPGGTFGCWDLNETVGDLINRAEIPEIIVVAIDNSPERLREYLPSEVQFQSRHGRMDAYLEFLTGELVPQIDSLYETIAEPEGRSHLGSSLGGLVSLGTLTRTNSFHSAICMSPSFWIDLDYFTEEVLSLNESKRLWLDSGTKGISRDGYLNTLFIRDRILSTDRRIGEDFFYYLDPGAEHNESAWAKRTPVAVKWLYSN